MAESETERLHRYDYPPCDECGGKIERGHTRLHTGQIYHHDCADSVVA